MHNVLIVDDHKAMRKGMALLLNDIGFEVIGQASDGKEFLELLKIQLPDIVLMDIQMPVMNGIDATRQALEQFPELKILILSMHDDAEYYNSLISIGAKGFILKESEHDEVKAAIDAILAGRLYFSQSLLVNLIRRKNDMQQINIKQREKDILQLLCKGLSSAEIADKLNLSSRTVEKIRSELLQKTETTNSISLAIFAVKNNLVEI